METLACVFIMAELILSRLSQADSATNLFNESFRMFDGPRKIKGLETLNSHRDNSGNHTNML